MSRRRLVMQDPEDKTVTVRCNRCRRIIGRLGSDYFQAKHHPFMTENRPQPVLFQFPAHSRRVIDGALLGVTVIELNEWTISGVRCICRKRDGTQTIWALNLLWMYYASQIDQRIHDLIVGELDYGLTGIHDELEHIKASLRGGSATPEIEEAHRATSNE